MRKLIVSEFISLDGVIEAPQNWHFPFVTDDMQQEVMKSILDPEALLMGRVTYQEFASYWPTAEDDGSGLANKLNSTPKYVVSTTLDKADWNNSTIINGSVVDEIRKLKQQGDGIIGLTGSATLIDSLMEAGLIDEFQLMVHPVVVGSGKRLFKEGSKTTLKLVGSQPFQGGVILLRYQPDGQVSS
jgi:dihydrofolate reductase